MKVTVTLTFNLKINRDHLHSDTHVCAKFDEPRLILCPHIFTCLWLLRPGPKQINLKSIGIIYTPRQMALPNLTKLCQFRVYLSSGQGLVYIPICQRSL